jgi:hypothetical protein
MRTADLETDVAHCFAGDVAGHRLIVRMDQGLYRHLVFESREHSWNNRFELITAPGSLTITGDRGAHTFRRVTDMFQFFRSNPDRPHHINIGYWAEKLPDAGRSVQDYSEQVARQHIKEYLDEAIKMRDAVQRELDEENARQLDEWREDLRAEGVREGDPDYPPPAPEREEDWPELVKARVLVDKALVVLADAEFDGALSYVDGARQVLGELERIGLASDTWEWDLTDWDFHFIWCLHAIAWGIQQYDNAVRTGLHRPRTAPVPWDTPLPTTTPAKPKRQQAELISFERPAEGAWAQVPPRLRPERRTPGVETAEIAGGVL